MAAIHKSWQHTSGAAAVLFDTCSEIMLISQSYANSLGLKYVTNNTLEPIIRGNETVVGQIEGALTCASLNEGTQVEAKTYSSHSISCCEEGTNVQHMYDNLLSTHCFQNWGARPDPVTERVIT